MKKTLLLLAALMTFSFVACKPENDDPENNKEPQKPEPSIVTTLDAEEVTAVDAVLMGEVAAAGVEVGFQYSASDKFEAASTKSVEAEAEDDGSFSALATGMKPNTKYYFRAFATKSGKESYGGVKSLTTISQWAPEAAVNMGMVMTGVGGTTYNLRWATCNIGANAQEELGDALTLDEATSAVAQLGGKWRMPTENELNALKSSCEWTWTSENGVNGYIATGPGGRSIFIPAGEILSSSGAVLGCSENGVSVRSADASQKFHVRPVMD